MNVVIHYNVGMERVTLTIEEFKRRNHLILFRRSQ